MKQVALTLAALAVLGLAANQAFAKKGPSRSKDRKVAAKHGLKPAGRHINADFYRQVHRKRYANPIHRPPGYQHRRPRSVPVVVYPPLVRYPRLIVPYPRPYYPYPYYPVPSRGIGYYGSGITLGIGF